MQPSLLFHIGLNLASLQHFHDQASTTTLIHGIKPSRKMYTTQRGGKATQHYPSSFRSIEYHKKTRTNDSKGKRKGNPEKKKKKESRRKSPTAVCTHLKSGRRFPRGVRVLDHSFLSPDTTLRTPSSLSSSWTSSSAWASVSEPRSDHN